MTVVSLLGEDNGCVHFLYAVLFKQKPENIVKIKFINILCWIPQNHYIIL